MTTILQLATKVARDLGYQRSFTTLFASNEGDETPDKLLRALDKTTRWLANYYDWPQIRGEHTFTTGSNPQTSAFPTSFRRIVKGSVYDRTNNVRVAGPVTAQEWQKRQAYDIDFGPPIFYVRGSSWYHRDNYADGATIAYEYISRKVGTNTGGTDITEFTADSDIAAWPDEVMHLGMVWAILSRDGAQGGADYEAFLAEVHEEINNTASGDALDMTGLPEEWNPVPETFPGLT